MTEPHRHTHHKPSQVTPCDAPCWSSHTSQQPKGCDDVTLVDVVPMPPVLWGRGTAAQLFLSLSRNSGGDC